ncbi:MAG TPA: hypothetical protein VFW71_03600 [Actinomycetota bacterium]|nr:hypothetical protein [Actinomycetota bacterium]
MLVLLGAGLFLLAAMYGVGSTRTPPTGSAEVILAVGGPGAPDSGPATITPTPSPGDTSTPPTGPSTVALPQVQSVGRSVQQSSVTKLLSPGTGTGQTTTPSGGSVQAAGPIVVPNTGGSVVSGPDQPPAQPVAAPSPSSDGTGAHTVPVPAPSQTAPLGGLLGGLLNPKPKPSPTPATPTSTAIPAPTSSP